MLAKLAISINWRCMLIRIRISVRIPSAAGVVNLLTWPPSWYGFRTQKKPRALVDADGALQ
jgi:hypothetical protein